jgi:hypothetical protein
LRSSAATSRALSSPEYVSPDEGRTTVLPSREAIIDEFGPVRRSQPID